MNQEKNCAGVGGGDTLEGRARQTYVFSRERKISCKNVET